MKIEIKQELRPCKFSISGQNWEGWSNGLLHCFGNVNGEMKGIVENENGAVFTVKPFLIKFLDGEGKFKEYCFKEEEYNPKAQLTVKEIEKLLKDKYPNGIEVVK